MTKQEYKEFQDAFNHGIGSLQHVSTGFCSGCKECCEVHNVELGTDEEICDEPHFSWRPCECCGSSLGGDRHSLHGFDPDLDNVHLDVCTDCLYYSEYGRLDDTAMQEIENSNS